MKRFLMIIIYITLLSKGFSNELFIGTDPMRANVYIDEEWVGFTPLRIKNISQETLKIKIKKDGYEGIQKEVILGNERSVSVFYTLSSQNILLIFNQNDNELFINRVKVGDTPLIVKNLPNGSYSMEKGKGYVSISSSRYNLLRRTTLIEAAFTTGLLGVSIGGLVHYNKNGDSLNASTFGFSTFIFSGLFGYNLLKLYRINNGIKEERIDLGELEVKDFDYERDREIFSEGMELVGRESWKEALTKFLFLVNVYNESVYTPIGVYEIAYCYYKLGDYVKAIDYFKKYVNEFPTYELFNYGLFYLLDLQLKKGAYYDALKDYEALKPIHLDDENGIIYRYYVPVFSRLYEETGEKDSYLIQGLIEELDYYLGKYRDSMAYPEVYLYKGFLLYRYLDKEKGIQIFNDIEKKYPYRRDIISKMEDIINGREDSLF